MSMIDSKKKGRQLYLNNNKITINKNKKNILMHVLVLLQFASTCSLSLWDFIYSRVLILFFKFLY